MNTLLRQISEKKIFPECRSRVSLTVEHNDSLRKDNFLVSIKLSTLASGLPW